MYTLDEIKNKVFLGHCLEELRKFPENSIDCCVTSPPYYSLRDYGTPPVIFGGNKNCDHNFENTSKTRVKNANSNKHLNNSTCTKCNAKLTNFGLESTPEEYISNSVEIYREVRRVLKPEGTFWLNIGDCYSDKNTNTLKKKDLIGIPWELAFALRDDGWYFRQEIIWLKGNPMPSSVKDRCVSAHEHVFLFSKSPNYYFDYKSIREKSETIWNNRNWNGSYTDKMSENHNRTYGANTFHDKNNHGWRNKRDVWEVNTKPLKGYGHIAPFPEALVEPCIKAGSPEGGIVLDPFMGAGTIAVVSLKNRRKYTGTELNEEYLDIQQKRIENEVDIEKVNQTNNIDKLMEF